MDKIITNHHDMYLSLFPGAHLTTKFHLMLPYSMIVKLSGPLRNIMLFRFEAKHQELKEYARACFSRRNIPLTICNKFCLDFAHFSTQNQGRFVKLTEINCKCAVKFPVSVENCTFATSLKYKGTSFSIGDVVTK